MTRGHAKNRSRNTREMLPKEQRVCCIASRSYGQSGAQGMRRATNPRNAAELAAKSWSRIWRVHVEELQSADRPWETPNHEDMSVLPQLTVDGPSGFDTVVGSFKAKTGIGVDAIHPSMWSHRPVERCSTHTDLACPGTNPDLLSGPKDTDWRATHPTHAINRASVGTYAQAHSGSMDDFPDSVF